MSDRSVDSDEQNDEDDYQPIALPDPPLDEDARRAEREAAEARAAQREIVLGQLAMALEALTTAEDAGDDAQAAALRQRVEALTAQRNKL